jgi:hypothetical protein
MALSSPSSSQDLPEDWRCCYESFDFVQHSVSDPGILQMFLLLSQKNFGEIPQEIHYDVELASSDQCYYKYFSIIWTKFFVLIGMEPNQKFFITLAENGLIIEYDSIEKIVKHLIGNRKYYCQS